MSRRLQVPDEIGKAVHEFLYYRDVETKAAPVKNKARDFIKGWLTLKNAVGKFVNGREDENGHRYYDLPEPLTIGEATYVAIQAQRKTSSSIDLDKTEELLKSKGGSAYDIVFKPVVERRFDEDALFALNQRGVITDEELDSLEVISTSYSLVPVKGDTVQDDE